uniref:Uncharacterized protein n=1 Tax=Anguilla anguilla TaxID=7936 RepID=A0A0E9QPA1_ANGAN
MSLHFRKSIWLFSQYALTKNALSKNVILCILCLNLPKATNKPEN